MRDGVFHHGIITIATELIGPVAGCRPIFHRSDVLRLSITPDYSGRPAPSWLPASTSAQRTFKHNSSGNDAEYVTAPNLAPGAPNLTSAEALTTHHPPAQREQRSAATGAGGCGWRSRRDQVGGSAGCALQVGGVVINDGDAGAGVRKKKGGEASIAAHPAATHAANIQMSCRDPITI